MAMEEAAGSAAVVGLEEEARAAAAPDASPESQATPVKGAKPASGAKPAKAATGAKPAKAAPAGKPKAKAKGKGKIKGKGKAKAKARGNTRASGASLAPTKRKEPEVQVSSMETDAESKDESPAQAAGAITAEIIAGNPIPLAKQLFGDDDAPLLQKGQQLKQEPSSPGPIAPVNDTTGTLDYNEVRKMLGQLKTRTRDETHPEHKAACKALEMYGSMKGQDKVHFLRTYLEYKKGGKKLNDWAFSYDQRIQSGNQNKLGIVEAYCTRPCSRISIIRRQKVSSRLLLIITTHASSLLLTLIGTFLEMPCGRRITILGSLFIFEISQAPNPWLQWADPCGLQDSRRSACRCRPADRAEQGGYRSHRCDTSSSARAHPIM